MKWLLGSLGTVAGLVVLCLLLLVNLSVEGLVPFEQWELRYDNTRDARLGSGSLRLQSVQYPQLGVVAVAWRYCPGLQPLTWCLQLENSEMRAQGRVSLLGRDRLLLRDAQLDLRSLEPLGISTSTISARLQADIGRLELGSLQCPFSPVEASLSGEISGLRILGGAFGDVQLSGSTLAADQHRLVLDGGFLSGEVELDNSGSYRAQGEMTAPPELEGLIRNFASHLGGKRYAWQSSGQVPC